MKFSKVIVLSLVVVGAVSVASTTSFAAKAKKRKIASSDEKVFQVCSTEEDSIGRAQRALNDKINDTIVAEVVVPFQKSNALPKKVGLSQYIQSSETVYKCVVEPGSSHERCDSYQACTTLTVGVRIGE